MILIIAGLLFCRADAQEEAGVLGRRQQNNYTCLHSFPAPSNKPAMVNVEASWAANDCFGLKTGQVQQEILKIRLFKQDAKEY